MRAVSPLGREVVCHIKSPFLLLLQVHSKHQDRGRDYAWQHYLQASRKIAVLLPISVTVIQVQPVLWDAWYIWPWGLLKQLGLTLLYCSFIVKFPSPLHCWLSHAWGLSEGDWWHGRDGQCSQDGALPGSGLSQSATGQGRCQCSTPATETEETIWAWVLSLMLLHKKVTFIIITKICFFFTASSPYLSANKEKQTFSSPCHFISHTHDPLTCCLFSRIYTVSSGVSLPQGPIVLSQ